MTLNITIAARWLMAQSSDFRLTRSGVRDPVSETSQKQVVLQYFSWSGLVCYTGVASWGAHDTASWLEQVLTHEPGQRKPRQVVDRLAEEGSAWLKRIPLKDRRHSFTMIAFKQGVPHVYVISNFERGGGIPLSTPRNALMVTHIRPRGPRAVVTGYSPAVSDGQRQGLEQLLASSAPPQRIREAVARTSREAAGRAKGTVGESCVVAHLLPDGSGEAQVFGNLTADFLPVMISNGVNAASLVPSAMSSAGMTGPARLVGVTWTGSGNATVMLGAFRELSKQTGDGWPVEAVRPAATRARTVDASNGTAT